MSESIFSTIDSLDGIVGSFFVSVWLGHEHAMNVQAFLTLQYWLMEWGAAFPSTQKICSCTHPPPTHTRAMRGCESPSAKMNISPPGISAGDSKSAVHMYFFTFIPFKLYLYLYTFIPLPFIYISFLPFYISWPLVWISAS